MSALNADLQHGVRLRFLAQRGLTLERRAILLRATEATFLAMEAIGEQGSIDTSTVRPVDEVRTGYTMFFEGDVVVAKITPCFENGKGALIKGTLNGVGFGTTELHVVSPSGRLAGRYLYYLTVSRPFRQLGEAEMTGAAGQKRVSEDFVRDFRVPILDVARQRAIADFLDAETARIDALIAAKENLLAILAEKRRALITQAVTRGLDPNVAMRDSGIPWLGEIPAHWEDVRVRFLVDGIEQGWSPQADSREPSEDEWGVLKLSAVSRGKFDPAAAKAMPSELDPRLEYEIKEGDFLLTRANTPSLVGDACFVAATRPMLMLCDLIYRLRLRGDRIHGKYLSYFLVLPIGRTQIEADARGTSNSMVKISQEHIKSWRVPVPPVEEQIAVVEFLDKETASFNEMERATLLTVRLLRERREAVIAAAVTGQLEIASHSPQETPP